MPNPANKITQAKVAMLFDHPFFGNLAIGLEAIEKKNMRIKTMATDGRHLFYDPDFVLNTPLSQLTGVISHEVLHCALNHISRRNGRDERWQLATDFAANDIVIQTFDLPEGVLISGRIPGTDEFKDKNAEFIYSKLPEPIKITIKFNPMDSHDEWEGWGNGKGEGKDKKDGKDTSDGSSQNGQVDGATGEKPQNGDGDSEEDDLEAEWRERVAQAATSARMQGKFPAHLETIVGNLLQPKLNWKAILRDMIVSCAKSDFRIIPPNKKHLWRGFYLPSVYGEEINIAVAIDSSGSISDDEITEFLSEVKGICDQYDNYTIHLFICDAAIHQRVELHPYEPLPKIIGGRGGTSFIPPIKKAEEEHLQITAFVYLTDLFGPFPEQPTFPVIWVSVSPEDVKPPWGHLINLPRN